MDRAVLFFIQEHFHTPFTDAFFPLVTFLGEAGAVWILIALLFIGRKQERNKGIMLLAALVLTFLLGDCLLKNLIQRPRPFVDMPAELLIPAPSSYSFPSGHSSSSFAAAVILYKIRRSWGIVAFCGAGLIAFSRVFLFVHYPTDVLAGTLLGILVGTTVWYGYRKFFSQKEFPEKEKE